MGEDSTTKAPYVIDQPTNKVVTIEKNGDTRFLFMHEFKQLNSTNFPLLVKKEKDTVRFSQTIARGKRRPRFDETKADTALYKEIIVGGGWRPYGLEPVKSMDMVLPANRSFYKEDPNTGTFMPSWQEVARAKCMELTPEKMKRAIDNYLQCSGEVVSVGEGIEFMFEQGGTMLVKLKIGDPDEPSYQFLIEMRRPDSQRRSNFKDSFAYAVEDTTGEQAKVETVINLRSGATFFSEHFSSLPETENGYNPVMFLDERTVAESVQDGDVPAQRSAVEGNTMEGLKPYTDELKSYFMQNMNPMHQVEIAAAVVSHFSKTDQD